MQREYHDSDRTDDDGAPVAAATPNAADRQSVKAQERALRLKNSMRDDGVRIMLSSGEGRAFLAWLLFDVSALNSPLEAPSFNPAVVHFFAGRRQVALDLQAIALQLDRKGYMLMLSEHLR